MEIFDLNQYQAEQAIAQIEFKKSKIKSDIAQFKITKTRLIGEKRKISEEKKISNKKFQDAISKLKTKQQKDYKRKDKKRASDSFDVRVKSKANQIQKLSGEIADLGKEIAKCNQHIAQIDNHLVFLKAVEKLKPKMFDSIKNGQYSQFAQSLLSVIYRKLSHEQKLKYMAFVADTLQKIDEKGNNVLRNLTLDNLDFMIRDFVKKFRNYPDQ